MRFRRHSGSSVTFFAFQDVITGVAGVMLIVVLLLIIGKRRLAPSETPDDAGEAFAGLQAQLAEAENKLSLARERLAIQRAEARQTDAERQDARKLREAEHHGQKINEEQRRRRAELRELQTALQGQQRQLAALSAPTRQFLELSAELHTRQTALRRAKTRLAPETRREVAVLDCARSRWCWERRGQAPVVLGGSDGANPSAAWSALTGRIQALSPAQSLLIVAVRPSAGGFAMTLVQKIRAEFPDLPIALEPLAGEDAESLRLE